MPPEAIGRLQQGRGRQEAIDARTEELVATGLGVKEARAQALQEIGAGGATPGPPAPPSITFDDDSSEDAIDAPQEDARVQLPGEPETAGRGDQVARILEVIGGIGSDIGQTRSINKANKSTAQRQALSNLVNTLRGSNTTQVSPEAPGRSILSTLGGAVSKGARSFREADTLGRGERNAAERDRFTDTRQALLDEDKRTQQGVENERAAAQAKRDERRVLIAESKISGPSGTTKVISPGQRLLGSGGEVLYTAPEAPVEPDKEIFRQVTGASGEDVILRWKAGAGPDEKGAWVESFNGAARPGKLPTTAALAIADVETLESVVARLQNLFLGEVGSNGKRDPSTGAFFRGGAGALVRAFGIDFDPESGLVDRLLRMYAPLSAELVDDLTVNGLRFAALLNRGRPSERDLDAAKRLLPAQSDSDELAERKFEAMLVLMQVQKVAIETKFTGNWSDLVNFRADGTPLVDQRAMLERIGSGEIEAIEEANDAGVPLVNVENIEIP